MLMLDTHALVWLASDQSKLTPDAKAVIREHAGDLCMSSISGMEIALLHKRSRLELPLDPATFVARALNVHGIVEIPVTAEMGCRAAALPDIHNDPFDRIIVAACQAGGHVLLSKDGTIPRYPGMTVRW